jgi:tetratricopeptide (TPR) repeat protein
MRKYLLHVLIISCVFFLTSTVPVASYAGEIETYKQEVEKNPDDAFAHYNLGVVYGESGMYEESIESYKQAIRIDPDDAGAHFNLGDAYLGLNDEDSALEQYEILKSLDSELANKLFDEIYSE